MNNSTNIPNIMTSWGRSQHQMPAQNEMLKSKVLDALHVRPIAPQERNLPLPWLIVACSGLAIMVLFIQIKTHVPTKQYTSTEFAVSSQTKVAMQDQIAQTFKEQASNSLSLGTVPPDIQRQQLDYTSPELKILPPSQQIPGNDSREFLKTDYSASIVSRHVPEMTERIQTTIRGFYGRVDSMNNSSENGYISFVVPVNHFDAFKAEIKSLAGARFYIEQTQSENLLPEKKSIEDQQTQTQDSLNQTQTQRDQLTKTHSQNIASINYQLNTIAAELANLQTQLQNHPEQQPEVSQKQQQLWNSRGALQKRLANENSSYSSQLESYNAQIQNYQSSLKNLDGQNTNLLNTVATVRGTITINHINFWEFLNYYVAIYWIMFIIALAVITGLFIYFLRPSKLIVP